jgi:hypothetical protein
LCFAFNLCRRQLAAAFLFIYIYMVTKYLGVQPQLLITRFLGIEIRITGGKTLFGDQSQLRNCYITGIRLWDGEKSINTGSTDIIEGPQFMFLTLQKNSDQVLQNMPLNWLVQPLDGTPPVPFLPQIVDWSQSFVTSYDGGNLNKLLSLGITYIDPSKPTETLVNPFQLQTVIPNNGTTQARTAKR